MIGRLRALSGNMALEIRRAPSTHEVCAQGLILAFSDILQESLVRYATFVGWLDNNHTLRLYDDGFGLHECVVRKGFKK